MKKTHPNSLTVFLDRFSSLCTHDRISPLDGGRYMWKGPFLRYPYTQRAQPLQVPSRSGGRPPPRVLLFPSTVLYTTSPQAALSGPATQSLSWFLFHGGACTNVSSFSTCRRHCHFNGPPSLQSPPAPLSGGQPPRWGHCHSGVLPRP